MHAFDVLGDPVRRRILELLAERRHASGEVVEVIQAEFGISQAAVSQHLKVLRENGFATVDADGARRIYTLDATPMRQVDDWLGHFRGFWTHKLESLATEVSRDRKKKSDRRDA
ncbi:transcriptional regulator [Hyphomonas sp. CACIAM 19H1]|uniref:ArsR/SmtB family transcription factor n=1 Tax=Hyphomonas sp. CACIAM 19H1 TaxID=1873716 RepID=UPI000DEDAB0A|nr:metalloregulator ArsR/SmtB family transcription factor [Hyphomonas sp. CACIAM 19H1]AXE63404.1 transcriptional regulator [Hyphomonas sp. CACIAM 19H1]